MKDRAEDAMMFLSKAGKETLKIVVLSWTSIPGCYFAFGDVKFVPRVSEHQLDVIVYSCPLKENGYDKDVKGVKLYEPALHKSTATHDEADMI
ncbi:hypothetical protein R1flu_003602 [Riccia fluitans]|uniref:Uncharacterized protein n=1 Tax=Riccia fluitans TaxID=41844 RepID=A0ABD1Y9G5_9MARC